MRLGAVTFTFPMEVEIVAADNGPLRFRDEARGYGIEASIRDVASREKRATRPYLQVKRSATVG